MKKYETNKYIRITKKEAEKRYNCGLSVHIAPCNYNIESPWIAGGVVANAYKFGNRLFKNVIKEFMFYNCNSEAGYYPAYYKEK